MREDVETIIDRLLEYVNKAGKVSLNDAAAAMGRTPAQVERLALLLEEKELLEVHYNVSGVSITRVSEEGEESRPAGAEAVAEKPVDAISDEGRRLEQQVMESESLIEFFEKDLERRVAIAEKLVDGLEKQPSFTKKQLENVMHEVDLALKQLDAFEQEIGKLAKKHGQFRQKLTSFRQHLQTIKPVAEQSTQAPKPSRIAGPASFIKFVLADILAFLSSLQKLLPKLPKPPAKAGAASSSPPVKQPASPAPEKKKEFAPIAALATVIAKPFGKPKITEVKSAKTPPKPAPQKPAAAEPKYSAIKKLRGLAASYSRKGKNRRKRR